MGTVPRWWSVSCRDGPAAAGGMAAAPSSSPPAAGRTMTGSRPTSAAADLPFTVLSHMARTLRATNILVKEV